MRALFCLLLSWTLTAQEPAAQPLTLDLRTDLNADPFTAIQLVPPHCWDGLLLSSITAPPPPRPKRRAGEATVEVWDFAYQEPLRDKTFRLFLGDLRERLLKALAAPPASHAAIELAEFMSADPSNPAASNLNTVRSMQERYNRLPPSGSPVK